MRTGKGAEVVILTTDRRLYAARRQTTGEAWSVRSFVLTASLTTTGATMDNTGKETLMDFRNVACDG